QACGRAAQQGEGRDGPQGPGEETREAQAACSELLIFAYRWLTLLIEFAVLSNVSQNCEKGRTCFAMGRVSSVYNSSMSWLSAVDRLRLFLRQLLEPPLSPLGTGGDRCAAPDDRLSDRVHPIVVFAIGGTARTRG